MSSTNRSNSRDFHKSDYYVTPVNAIRRFLKQFYDDYYDAVYCEEILDPCAGGDNNNTMSYPEALSSFTESGILTIDIREDSGAEVKGDYLKMGIHNRDMIITNPPFAIAEQIIEKALKDVKDYGFVVMLLRLNFLGGKARQEGFWSRVGLPDSIYVHPKRMSFTDDGKTDSIEYAHFVWVKGKKKPDARIRFVQGEFD